MANGFKSINMDKMGGAQLKREPDLSPIVTLFGHRATIDPRKPGEKLSITIPLDEFMAQVGLIQQQMDAEAARAQAVISNLKKCEKVRMATYEDPAQAD
jgi:hypothetical protein